MPRDLLPAYELITKKQEAALRHPDLKSLLVTGPPGCGKTVVALYRADKLVKKKKEVQVLTYGKVLLSYIDRAVSVKQIRINTSTWHSWFYRHIYKEFGRRPPQIEKFVVDFPKLFEWYTERGITQTVFDQLVIDEGQDLSLDFYRLAVHISGNMTVFADENQAIFEGLNSTIREIRGALKKFDPKEIKLTKNFRNTKNIAEFASLFVTKELETGSTDLPDRKGERPLLCKAGYMDEQTDYIIKHIKRYPNHQVGVFLPRKSSVKKYYNELESVYGRKVQYYTGGKQMEAPDFGRDGIFVVTYWSAKGLEFDDVFVPDLQDFDLDDGGPVKKMQLYVVFSRPRERLFLMFTGNMSTSFRRIIDENSELIKEITLGSHQEEDEDEATEDEIPMSEFYYKIEANFDEDEAKRIIKKLKENYSCSFVDKKKLEDCIEQNIPGKTAKNYLYSLLVELLMEYEDE